MESEQDDCSYISDDGDNYYDHCSYNDDFDWC